MGGKEDEYGNISENDAETKRKSGDLAEGKKNKLLSEDAQRETKTKSPFFEVLIEMNKQRTSTYKFRLNVNELERWLGLHNHLPQEQLAKLFTERVMRIEQVPEASSEVMVEEDQPIHDEEQESQEVDVEPSTKVPTHTTVFDLDAPPQAKIDDPPNLPADFEPKRSPFLEAITSSVLFQAKDILREQEADRRRQQNTQAVKRYKKRYREHNPEEAKEKERLKKQRQRARKKQQP